ncbi:efflux RND transporter periplasmic adaptor subunit [Neptuniibacter caesariensis]|uniref:Putative cation efflux system protein n=1 Tax=Neptuniibacter caesariensis TaxID=207954 RepID=A0A7U8GSX9_NEPCE|nr:efflux RND transporter periplasmic adaptor subunit [Neptuniibacter caesariensis]EAR61555.1 putative cation efflux system protein [Oceanospirillum sp. MED92] [Neptuniibacter caesariensis]
MNKGFIAVIALSVGAAAGYWAPKQSASESSAEMGGESQPLYWVAPMDPNFKRDKPGLSPMGMDLVPVYPEDLAGGDSPGMISIQSEVVNNLGVRTEPVIFSPMQERLSTVGYLGFDQEQLVDVHSRVSGWVETLAVNTEGEAVEKGQLLYEIYSPELVNAQEEYLAALQSGNRYLRRASESKLKSLGADESIFEKLKSGKQSFNRLPVYAPQSGYVSQLNVRQGMFIKPASKLMRIGPLQQIWATAELFERQAGQVSVGDQAEMRLDFLPGKSWRGKVDYIYPALDQKTRTLKVRLRFENPDLQLKPDMFARIEIETSATKPVLNVPASALIKTGSQERIVVDMGEGRYKSVEVTSGQQMNGRVAIEQGLYPQDRVVVSAQFMLDSESSISSDFLRMTPPKMGRIEEVWVAAQIRSVDQENRSVVLKHGEIAEWKQPGMVMEVPVDPALDMNVFANQQNLQVLLNGGDMTDLKLTDYVVPRPKAPGSLPGGAM